MVQVLFNDSDDSPTQAYALARWRENPRISPSSWRQMLGLTVGKIAFDGRYGLQGMAEAIAMGCNLLVVPVALLNEALKIVGDAREQVVVVGVGAPADYRDGADWWLWDVEGLLPDKDGLSVLEQAVKDGRLGAYGVSGEVALPLDAWLAAAKDVAAAVWGRRKRSGLRVVEVPLNGIEQQALRGTTGDASDSIMEEAARLGMAVLVRRAAHWRGPWGEVEMGLSEGVPSSAGLAALVAVGEAEKGVSGLAGGVLPALAAGVSPWPTRLAWHTFEKQVWPGLEQALLQRGEEAYVMAWRGLLPHGKRLAWAAESQLSGLLAEQLAVCLPEIWQNASVLAQTWGLASSVPGVSAVVADLRDSKAQNSMVEAIERPDVIDVKRALDGVIHRA